MVTLRFTCGERKSFSNIKHNDHDRKGDHYQGLDLPQIVIFLSKSH